MQKFSDCVVHLQDEDLPACSQVLGLQSQLLADILQDTKLERGPDGRKIVPFADNEPAMAQLIKFLHMPIRERQEILSKQSLAAVARLLSLASKYGLVDLAYWLLDDRCSHARCARAPRLLPMPFRPNSNSLCSGASQLGGPAIAIQPGFRLGPELFHLSVHGAATAAANCSSGPRVRL